MPSKKEISLLPDSENINNIGARAIRWVTTVGRYVIIFTELVVISAFISRFWLDRKNADLSEVIRQQKAILESTKDFETEYSLLQQRLKFIKDSNIQTSYSEKLTTLANSTPNEIIFDKLALSEKDNQLIANISVFSYTEESIIDFATNLILNPQISSVNISKIEKKPKENRYQIEINLVFKNETI
ncbi:hypothetical protein A2574_01320 [Candidatus Shapirobacteria bacterium RIFOXYD1_FULL_38_32]|uniref:Fimbrial assembly family protein n=3 Tax=Candidatus Shapironibacteriota TaxID=1752721 RepID=A0A0G0MX98_9BACT|nr:MAG: hypothetical protein US90_C0015G0004 [Candidatus Shapirobacteria bacterium GW2011_GWE2_38_30]OGL55683.1 MAG: hypothetical protein A2195_01350 [Candidatus Shapirobacteria bacterium RIFOXYA1_FULL_39_17]OGL56149.1 MAG: hypothetical protein A2410_02865 [Candidatus Shapirobacteria bacterium RIFOXYC1_FULL_38_24]OGL57208.1 MAG: hypothetical protein A2367_01170 [Candidatus Shapirobacteria bacterium RIFOXYB1_FULL_38_38]OGL57398.1 MAG: hypothetical protein A2574_01320 [Candidatus Shapirobacteria 